MMRTLSSRWLLVGWLVVLAGADAPENRRPPGRTRGEVDAVLSSSPKPAPGAAARPVRVLLVAGPKDHGKGEHDYPAWQKQWKPMLEGVPGVSVATAFGKPEPSQWEQADLAVFYCWGPQFWGEELYRSLDPFLARGGGLVVLHSGVIPAKDNEAEALAQRIGLALPPSIKYRHGPLDLRLAGPANHPITAGLPATLRLVDESYWPCVGDVSKVTVLATQAEAGEDRPMAWTFDRGKGRVFCTILGHYSWTLDDPLARLLVLRGMAWAAGQPAGRLDALALDGIEFKD